jgi:hypothetical protein
MLIVPSRFSVCGLRRAALAVALGLCAAGCSSGIATNATPDAAAPGDVPFDHFATPDKPIVQDIATAPDLLPARDAVPVDQEAPPDVAPDVDARGCWEGALTLDTSPHEPAASLSFAASGTRYALTFSTTQPETFLAVYDALGRRVGAVRPVARDATVMAIDGGFALVDREGVQALDLDGAALGSRVAVTLDPPRVTRHGDALYGMHPRTNGPMGETVLVSLPATARGEATETPLVVPAGWYAAGVGPSRLLIKSNERTNFRVRELAIAAGVATSRDVMTWSDLNLLTRAEWYAQGNAWLVLGAAPLDRNNNMGIRLWRLETSGVSATGVFGTGHANVYADLVQGAAGRSVGLAILGSGGGGALALLRGGSGTDFILARPFPGVTFPEAEARGAWSPMMDRTAVLSLASSSTGRRLALRCTDAP